MQQRTLGHSGLVVSAIGMGCNNFSRPGTATEWQDGSTAVIHAAIDAGDIRSSESRPGVASSTPKRSASWRRPLPTWPLPPVTRIAGRATDQALLRPSRGSA